MKVSTSHSSLFSKTLPSFGTRKRVASLKQTHRKNTENVESAEDQAICAKLELSLQNDIKRFSQLLTEPEQSLPGYDYQEPELKLWRYFLSRMELVKDKVEKEQVNTCQKQFYQIGKLINKRKDAHLANIERFKQLTKDKQSQIHQLFEQIKRDRMNNFLVSMKKRKSKDLMPRDNTEQIGSIKESVEGIRQDVVKIEALCQNEIQEEDKLMKEWKAFLVNLLRSGFYMSSGVKPIFKEMIRHQYLPQSQDFPDFVDSTTIDCFMKQYNSIKKTQEQKQISREVFKHRSLTGQRKESPSIRSIREITRQPMLSQVYKGTRDYIASWVKNGNWKEEKFLPKLRIKERKKNDQGQNWQLQERRRMGIVYPQKQVQKRVKTLLFGPRVELLS